MSKLLERADVLSGRTRGTAKDDGPIAYERGTFEAARDAVLALTKALNGGCRKAAIAGLLDGLTHEHRHLQNEAIWTILTALGAFGGLPSRFVDARNESAHKACGDIRVTLAERIYWPEWD